VLHYLQTDLNTSPPTARAWRYQAPSSDGSTTGGTATTKRVIPPYNATEYKRELVTELNRVRADAAAFADELDGLLNNDAAWDGSVRFCHPQGRSESKMTMREGKAAVKDAIAFFKDLDQRAPLRQTDLLDAIAQGLAAAPGTSAESRLKANKAEAQFGNIIEATMAGELSAKETVFLWLLCDGDATRATRKALCSTLYKEVGVGTSKPATTARNNVMSLAIAVTEAGQLPNREVFGRDAATKAASSAAAAKAETTAAKPTTASSARAEAAAATAVAAPAASATDSGSDPKFCSSCGASLGRCDVCFVSPLTRCVPGGGGKKSCTSCGTPVK
jgi:hypothetical protein